MSFGLVNPCFIRLSYGTVLMSLAISEETKLLSLFRLRDHRNRRSKKNLSGENRRECQPRHVRGRRRGPSLVAATRILPRARRGRSRPRQGQSPCRSVRRPRNNSSGRRRHGYTSHRRAFCTLRSGSASAILRRTKETASAAPPA
jgi:hypothetical protein